MTQPAPCVSATKTAGTFAAGRRVTYTIVLTNAGPGAQPDNPGDEFTDVLPAQLTLVAASATSGTAVATVGHQHRDLERLDSRRRLGDDHHPGHRRCRCRARHDDHQPGHVAFDADGNGTNEASAGDRRSGGRRRAIRPPSWWAAGSSTEIPTLDEVGLAALALLLAFGGAGGAAAPAGLKLIS